MQFRSVQEVGRDDLYRLEMNGKWFEKKFFWDVWLQNRLESWLKIRIFQKFFLHVFKHQKIFQKNQSDKISHKKLT